MVVATLPRIKFLTEPTTDAWVEQTLANMNTILLDHSHCERKAASVALKLMFRYPSNQRLVRELTAIAQEELLHFEQVNQILEARKPMADKARKSEETLNQIENQIRNFRNGLEPFAKRLDEKAAAGSGFDRRLDIGGHRVS